MTLNLRKFGDRIREARRAKGWSQEELGLKMGGAQFLVWRYENAKSVPKIDTTCRLASALGVSIDWLVGMG